MYNNNKKMIGSMVCSFCMVSLSMVQGCKSEERPNILWIVADDISLELGCYGNQDVRTPNLDRLADQGVLYTNCFVTSPVCSPSRSSLITGMYPPVINSLSHRTVDKQPLPPGIHPITKYFREAGYFCSNGHSDDRERRGKTDFNFTAQDIFDGTDWSQRANGQPFFAQIQIFEPHRPFYADPDHPVSPETLELPDCYPDHPLLRADWALYLETIQHADKKVGEILHRLEEEGLADNTVVFFFGDNGRPHLRDKQFLYEGGLKVPLIIRWPDRIAGGEIDDQLISVIDIAATSLAIASIDIPLHLDGRAFDNNDTPPRDFILGFRGRMGNAIDDMRSISDGKYKLIWNRMPHIPWMQMSSYKKLQYPAFALYHMMYEQGILKHPYVQFMAEQKPIIELYWLETDPYELVNLADEPEYSIIRDGLFSILSEEVLRIEKDALEESPEAIEQALTNSHRYYLTGLKDMGLSEDASYEELVRYWEKLLLNKTQ